MHRTLSTTYRMLVVSTASALIVISAGCSNSSCNSCDKPAAKPVAATPLSIPDNPRAMAPTHTTSAASANNSRDLAAAQPDTVIDKGSTRDLDLGGGGGEGQPGQPLSYQSLGDVLRKMGVNPEDDKDCYIMKVKAKTEDEIDWTFPIAASLSGDQSVIWITCPIIQVDKNGSPAAPALQNLLNASYKLGTTFFVVDDRHMVVLQHPVQNLGVTPQVLGAHLKLFFNALKASEPAFKPLVNTGGGDSGGGGGGNPFQ